ncbi:hypothetical protein [Deinococcus radiophilus]|uniref:hypothetical protein n=1 Tax=Deinococcus radiophilus TaxID=32062 RepID=UPI003614253B
MTQPIPLEGGQSTLFDRIGAPTLQALLWDFYGRVCQTRISVRSSRDGSGHFLVPAGRCTWPALRASGAL